MKYESYVCVCEQSLLEGLTRALFFSHVLVYVSIRACVPFLYFSSSIPFSFPSSFPASSLFSLLLPSLLSLAHRSFLSRFLSYYYMPPLGRWETVRGKGILCSFIFKRDWGGFRGGRSFTLFYSHCCCSSSFELSAYPLTCVVSLVDISPFFNVAIVITLTLTIRHCLARCESLLLLFVHIVIFPVTYGEVG